MTERLFVRLDEDPVQGPETTAPAGTLRAFPVIEPLRAYVSHVLLYRETIASGTEIAERVVPDGAVRLSVNFAGSSAAGSSAAEVIGPSAEPTVVRLRGQMHGAALTLRPGAALALLAVPAGSLAGQIVPLDALWGRQIADELADRMAAARDDRSRLQLLQAVLLRELRRRASGVDPAAVVAWHRIVQTAGRVPVAEVADAVGVSERRLQQLFKAEVGLAPRTWRRLARLHSCIRALRQNESRWAEVAAARGFYDQAHMIREFRDLCGCTPAEFRRQAISGSSNTAR